MPAVALLFVLLAAPAAAGEVRGVTVSCPTWGWEWGSPDMVQTLDELDAIGASWVAIHPYAGIRKDGTVRWKPIDRESPPDWLTVPIREAHARGLKVMIKPHIAYWGSGFSWRGEIDFDDPAARTRFFVEYRAWVTDLAAASTDADAFVVGTELDGLTDHDAEWRAVIASVRGAYGGPLTYAANWDAYQRVGFWDDLDVIGIQAYFPLAEQPTTDRAALDAGWDRVMGELTTYADARDQHVVFTELGYPRSRHAAVRPWEARDEADQAALQAVCLDAALDAIERTPRVIGAFTWKWFPGDRVPRDFALQRPEARAVLEQHWAGP